jgi:hypothetical protein
MRRRLLRRSDRLHVQLLLREYDNLARDVRTLLTGQYTLGMIGVILPLGVLTAALQFGRQEVALALPGAMILVACGIGVQEVMMAYRETHLSAVEDSINRLCGHQSPPLLAWFTCRSEVHLTRRTNPTTLWLGIILLGVLLIYVGAVTASVYVLLSGVPGPFDGFRTEGWRRVGASLFAIGHVLLGAAVGSIFVLQGRLVKSAYKTVQGELPHPERRRAGS